MKVDCDSCRGKYDDFDHTTICPHPWFPRGTFVTAARSVLSPEEFETLSMVLAVVRDADALLSTVDDLDTTMRKCSALDGTLQALREHELEAIRRTASS